MVVPINAKQYEKQPIILLKRQVVRTRLSTVGQPHNRRQSVDMYH